MFLFHWFHRQCHYYNITPVVSFCLFGVIYVCWKHLYLCVYVCVYYIYYIIIYILLYYIINIYILLYYICVCICNIATSFLSLFYVVFESTLLNYAKPLSKLDLPTLRKGSREERTCVYMYIYAQFIKLSKLMIH